jgi:hypothetical protein
LRPLAAVPQKENSCSLLRTMLTVLIFGLVPQPASVRLDPLALIATKGAQTSTRRPYRPPAQNSGLQTATLALG